MVFYGIGHIYIYIWSVFCFLQVFFFLHAARHPGDSDGRLTAGGQVLVNYGIRTSLGQHCTAECHVALRAVNLQKR